MEADSPPLGVAASPAPPGAWPEPAQLLPAAPERPVSLPGQEPVVWPRSAQLATALLLVAALILLAWHGFSRQRGSTRPMSLTPGALTARIDLNQADRVQLLQLPGVGETMADRILAYRAAHGAFRRVDELRRVEGIGPALLERLRPLVHVELAASDDKEEAPPMPVRGPMRAVGKKAPPGRIDVNQASAEELQRLPGIGPRLAQRIVMARKDRPFRSIDDLRAVPGIGSKTLQRLRPFVEVAAAMKQDAKRK